MSTESIPEMLGEPGPDVLVPPLYEYAVQFNDGHGWRLARRPDGFPLGETTVDQTAALIPALRQAHRNNGMRGMTYRVVGRQVSPWMEVGGGDA